MKIHFFLFLFSSLIFTSCEEGDDSPQYDDAASIQFVSDTIQRQTGNCINENSNCYTIKWLFPQVDKNDAFAALINKEIIRVVASNLDPEGLNSKDLEKLITGMQEDFNDFVKEFPESGVNMWFDETVGEVLINNEKIISIGLENSSFYGGAHPNSYKTYLNFSPETKKKMEVGDLFTDTLAVAKIVEKFFREERDLDVNVDLNSEGFFLLDDDFFLPASIGVKENLFIFYYNPYEIGPYSMGHTEVIVKRKELEQYLKI